MRKKGDEIRDEEHPWVRQARKMKAENNQSSRETDEEPSVPRSGWQTSHKVLLASCIFFLVMAGLALRMMWVSPVEPRAERPVLRVWHHVSLAEGDVLSDIARSFGMESGVEIEFTAFDGFAVLVGAIYGRQGPDIVILDQAVAEQLAQGGALLTLEALSPLYRTLPLDAYFLPLAGHSAFSRPIGVSIPRSSRAPTLAKSFLDYVRAALAPTAQPD